MGKPLTQGLDIFSVSNHQRFNVKLWDPRGGLVFEALGIEAMDRAHAVKLAIRKYRDAGNKADKWSMIEAAEAK